MKQTSFPYCMGLAVGLALILGLQSCRDCRSSYSQTPMLVVSMQFPEVGEWLVSGALIEEKLVQNDGMVSLPIALDKDLTVYDFTNPEGRVRRLAISYKRILKFENPRCGYYLQFDDVRVTSDSDFSNIYVSKSWEEWSVTLAD